MISVDSLVRGLETVKSYRHEGKFVLFGVGFGIAVCGGMDGQAAAREHVGADGCDAVGKHHAGQAKAPMERQIADGCDTIRDHYAG